MCVRYLLDKIASAMPCIHTVTVRTCGTTQRTGGRFETHGKAPTEKMRCALPRAFVMPYMVVGCSNVSSGVLWRGALLPNTAMVLGL